MLELWAEILHFFFSQMIDTNSVNFKKIWGGGWNDCQTFMWNYTETIPEIREKATFLEVISKAIIYNFEAIDLSPTSLNHRWDLATIWKQDSCRQSGNKILGRVQLLYLKVQAHISSVTSYGCRSKITLKNFHFCV